MLSLFSILLTGLSCVLWDGVHAYEVRLANGHGNCSGRVEVLRNNQWGTVCDHDWDLRDAHVVCLQLGCGFAEYPVQRLTFGPGSGEIWLRHVQCSGHESSLDHCSFVVNSNLPCTHNNDAGVICSGTLLVPTLTLLSPHTVFSSGESVRFSCHILVGQSHVSDFYLYKDGVQTPLVTQKVEQSQSRVELTLFDVETFQQGSYSCRYRIMGDFPLQRSPPSNSMNITVVDLLTPQHWYNTSLDAPPGSVIRGHSFNITCSTLQQYPGASFQLRLVRSNGTVRHTLPALTPSVTFNVPSAQTSDEGYYYCLYRVQLGGRTFVSRESQPLPISVRDPEPLLSPMVISWMVSGLTFVIAVIFIITVAKVLCNKPKQPSELERETRTCVDNTYVALSINKL